MIERPFRIVVAPDSFKGSLSAYQAALSMEKGIHQVMPNAIVEKLPLSDGGEGLVQTVVQASYGKFRSIEVTGPDFEPVIATYGFLDEQTAVMEMAEASGLTLSKWQDPSRTTTYGTGEMIRDALKQGATKIILGIGGSATNDGGVGMAAAIGVRFLDQLGQGVDLSGSGLSKLASIDCEDLDPRLKEAEILVACDVTNPLYGENGAAYIYATQKGADKDMVQRLDQGLKNYARVLKDSLGVDCAKASGAGAAGGMGAGLLAFAGARLRPGIEICFEMLDFDSKLKDADLILTGEGSIDSQTLHGKVLLGVARRAKARNIPAIGLCGRYSGDLHELHQEGIDAIFSINHDLMELEEALRQAEDNLTLTTSQIMKTANIWRRF
jgi:glycerate kinase